MTAAVPAADRYDAMQYRLVSLANDGHQTVENV